MLKTIQLRCCAAVWSLGILSGSLVGAEPNRVAAWLARTGEPARETPEAAADPLAREVLTSADFHCSGGQNSRRVARPVYNGFGDPGDGSPEQEVDHESGNRTYFFL